ncbi:asparagine synthase (glutamine-hydrolyzing) [Mucilaginibacter litoreus]|uniref:asparagine synthase (glutamine-hydrolyzing) n=1 Tax=Mucilaginibacter litoreus TaxID=1048221 RepID=A0ABW3AVI0_9SPHI
MCRIAGLVSNRLDINKTGIVQIMCDTLQHGGPDDEGIYTAADKVVLGHRRLSVIDLERRGRQPMADIAQRAHITFNGEIYNYPELKAELLKLGAVFITQTDTEVIIQAYLHWGINAFGRLRGMFAFALYDNINKKVYLVRDSAGIKPLYYNVKEQQLAFASEVKALQIAGIATTKNPDWPVYLLAFGHIPEPYTTLKDVYSLPKGHFFCWEQDGSYTIKAYQVVFEPINYTNDIQGARLALYDTLKKAVGRQLIADAPIGVFLSGGVDSSLLTLLANQEEKQLKTISIFFNEQEYDERKYQKAVLNRVNGESFTHLVTQAAFDSNFQQIIAALDMPTTDGINSWFISKYARESGLKAVISGIGADEIFGGYPSFRRIKYLKTLRSVPAALLRAANHWPGGRFKRFAYLANDHPIADYLFLRGLFIPSEIKELTGADSKEIDRILFDDKIGNNTLNNDKLKASWFETNLYMQNQLLHDTDVMSMCHGLEVRVPYLDEDLLHQASMIHPDIRFGGKQGKQILIDTFKDILPEVVWNRPKMGFTFPLQQWMKESKQITNLDLYNSKAAKSTINKFTGGRLHWSRAFALYHIQGHV